MVCKLDAVYNAFSAIIEQLALFFGIVMLASPKPSITYVKMVRYLTILSSLGSFATIIFSAIAYSEGKGFMQESSSCFFDVSSREEDISDMLSLAYDVCCREALMILLYLGLIWGTFAIVPVLERGGTGDERIGDSDVLSIVKKNPPKILVLSSISGFVSLRGSALILCMVTLGLSGFNSFSNIWRISVWCGSFEMEGDWCVWPYGILSMIEQIFSVILSVYTALCLVRLGELKKLPPLSTLWICFAATCFVFTCTALVICALRYPSYWLSGMKRDFWVYYARFWISLTLFFLIRSIKLLRLAGGVGWEDESAARELIYENLSEEKDTDVKSIGDSSLNDLLGVSASIAPRQVSYQIEPVSDDSSSNESSGIHTPTTTVVMGGSVAALPSQAVEGVSL
jgi:hypothetical protein